LLRWRIARAAPRLGAGRRRVFARHLGADAKCPLCLAAHVALWTGLGMSFAVATYFRWALLLMSGLILVYLVLKRKGLVLKRRGRALAATRPFSTT
jgi:hypothetical protein